MCHIISAYMPCSDEQILGIVSLYQFAAGTELSLLTTKYDSGMDRVMDS